jgi:two-component system chemotaxis sensor kinase CheA
MDELLAQFIVEGRELAQQAADDLIALEREPRDRQRLESAFRAIHTLKGSVGLFPLAPLQTVLHAAEDLLGAVRSGSEEIDIEAVDPILATLEWTDRCIDEIEVSGELGPGAGRQAEQLLQAMSRTPVMSAGSPPAGNAGENPPWARTLFDACPAAEGPLVAVRYVPDRDCFFIGDDPLALAARVPSILNLSVHSREDWPAPEELDPFRCNLVIELVSSAPLTDVEAVFRLIPDQVTVVSQLAPTVPDPGRRAGAGAPLLTMTVRVDTARIDRLLDIVGELYTAKNGLASLADLLRTVEPGSAVARRAAATQLEFDRLLTRLRQGVMGVRMVPLAQTFRRLPRVVRELSGQTGKKVEIVTKGGEIEADRLIVEGLFEPLLHVIRNAMDHGIESADARSAAGKPAIGSIAVTADMQGDQVAIAIADDGAGVDVERARALAVRQELVSADIASGLPEEGVLELLFAPGFSTARSVTEISGRGVGMDAVRTAVQALGGRVSMSSRAGQGSTVAVSLPTSFAMARLVVLEAGGDRFAVPMNAIAETLRISRSELVAVRAGLAFTLRDRVIPFVSLAEVLHLTSTSGESILLLVVEREGGGRVGIGVDSIGEQTEIMVRPATGLIRHSRGIAGTAVLGDGRVLMVLDLEELTR